MVAAYELHKHVNRNSDGIGSNAPGYAAMLAEGDPSAGGGGPLSQYLNWGLYNFVASAYGATGSCTTAPSAATYYCVNATPEFVGDIGDESAVKVGAQYVFDFGLTVNGIFERMMRKLPAALEFQNERQRNGTWLALTQTLGPKDNINFGWAHAGKTPGDPAGQHNYNPNNSNDAANMFTLAYKHHFDKSCTGMPTLRKPSTVAPWATSAKKMTPIVFCASLVPCASEISDADPTWPMRKSLVRFFFGTV